MKNLFRRVAARISIMAGTATVFLGAVVVVLVWASTGSLFHYSDTWQLVINTGTTIVTFLMVFLIQNTQNRDGKAVQLKLDELIRATKGAQLHYIGLEDMSDAELSELDAEFKQITSRPGAARAVAKLQEKIQAEHKRRHFGPNFHLSNPLHHAPTPPTTSLDEKLHPPTDGPKKL